MWVGQGFSASSTVEAEDLRLTYREPMAGDKVGKRNLALCLSDMDLVTQIEKLM